MNQVQVLVVRNKLHKKILVSAIKTLLEYHELTGKNEGSLRRIADKVGKAHSTVKRYLWELQQQGLVAYDGKKYVFNPDKLMEALEALGATKTPEKRASRLIGLVGDEVRLAKNIEKITTEIEKIKIKITELEKEVKTIKTMKKEQKHHKGCKNEKLLRELDEWSKSMDEWADKVDERLEDLEQRVKTLTNMVLRLIDEVRKK